jgi:ribonucleoside-diphosphate reductase alpha chain
MTDFYTENNSDYGSTNESVDEEDPYEMFVIKRNGKKQAVSFDKITQRIKRLVNPDEHKWLNPTVVSQRTIQTLKNGMHTEELDEHSASICANMNTIHPLYSNLGSRILVSNLHKKTLPTFVIKMIKYNEMCPENINLEYLKWLIKNKEEINSIVDYTKDYELDFFSFQTLKRSYLLKSNDGELIERPQDMFMRVASFINCGNIEDIKVSYELMSNGYFIHASPTLFNAGMIRSQLASCFLLGTEDSLEGIFKTITDSAHISKWAGGIGIHVSNIRGHGSTINGTGGKTNGILYMLRMYNELSRYINQGGKRNGSIAIYLEPHHCDIELFLELKKNTGADGNKTRDLFLSLWVSDYFMECVDKDLDWYLMSPDDCPNLENIWGEEYKQLYLSYVEQGKYRKVIKAKDIIRKVFESQIETGVPYIAFKDSVNSKTNQNNLGTIKSSNLCIEIMEYSDSKEYAVCNLASLCLGKYVNDGSIDYEKLGEVSYNVTKYLNNVIDRNYYPVPEAKVSNVKHRPIGLGIQGFADMLALIKVPFDTEEAVKISSLVMETIYYYSMKASNDMSIEIWDCKVRENPLSIPVSSPITTCGAYQTFNGSNFSKGKFQFDLWNVKPSDRYDWTSLKKSVMTYGTRNSLLTALMPTAATSLIAGNTECFEPITSNIYTRDVLAGEFIVINKYLIKDLIDIDMWNDDMKNKIIANNGSVQKLNIPENLKQIYKTVWEIKQKWMLDHSIARGAYVDQSQSLNIYFSQPDFSKLYSCLMYSWKNGLKTGSYYLRSKPAIGNDKSTVDINTSICESCSG